jgi:hypothetical protein
MRPVLHLFGLDHEKLTFEYQGREFRLTDVHGTVQKPDLAVTIGPAAFHLSRE